MRRLLLLSAALLAGSSARADEKYVTIKGLVKWNGDKAPAADVVDVKDFKAACCKDGNLLSNKFAIDAKSLGVKNVIVWLRPDTEDRTDAFPADRVNPVHAKPSSKQHVIDQPVCQFEPRVLAARAGDTLVVKNSSAIAHNINYVSDPESFNVTIQAGKEHKLSKPLEANRLPIAYKCDIHGWMTGRVRVFDHPYFATTDKDGNFEIADAPVGKWRIVYWHEEGYHKGIPGALGAPIELKGDKKTLELEPVKLQLPASKTVATPK